LALGHARVYIASRSEERVNSAIEAMRRDAGAVDIDVRFLQMDLQDLKSVKAAAASFMQRESRLDVLINNAGVSPGVLFVLGGPLTRRFADHGRSFRTDARRV
jgi:NAD(P)-dependent dehydrogenase (short-subunit alcohol dehydrogenase family)